MPEEADFDAQVQAALREVEPDPTDVTMLVCLEHNEVVDLIDPEHAIAGCPVAGCPVTFFIRLPA